ncbi:hypothetical protein DITRI_Ditri20bG0119000 [Diplodiscus trichospermus]
MAIRSLATRKTLTQGLNSTRLAQSRSLQTFSLPDLPYDYGALEPTISGEIMQLHHQKHHQTYITNYNKALEQLHEAIQKGDSSTVVKLQSAIKFNGGGHINHSIFWKNLAPIRAGGGAPPKGPLGWAIDTNFGSLDSLIEKINAEGAALQGSGWVWLGVDKELKKLVVETTANQDPLVTKGPNLVPLLGIDVWEHAYYLQYKNVRPEYLKKIWKVINWEYASEVGVHPSSVPLHNVGLWVQVYDLPYGFMSERVSKDMGSFIGTYIESDPKSTFNSSRGERWLRYYSHDGSIDGVSNMEVTGLVAKNVEELVIPGKECSITELRKSPILT